MSHLANYLHTLGRDLGPTKFMSCRSILYFAPRHKGLRVGSLSLPLPPRLGQDQGGRLQIPPPIILDWLDPKGGGVRQLGMNAFNVHQMKSLASCIFEPRLGPPSLPRGLARIEVNVFEFHHLHHWIGQIRGGVSQIRRNAFSVPQIRSHMSCTFEPYQNRIKAISLYQIHNQTRNVFKLYQNHINALSLYEIHIHVSNALKPNQNRRNALSL